ARELESAAAGRVEVELAEKVRERRPTRYRAGRVFAVPRVDVVYVVRVAEVRASARTVLLLPLQPRLIVRYRPIPVVLEPYSSRARRDGISGRRDPAVGARRVTHARTHGPSLHRLVFEVLPRG